MGQTVGLAALAVVAATHSGWLRRSSRAADADLVRPLTLLAVGAALLLLQDTGDVGQRVGEWVEDVAGHHHLLIWAAQLPVFATGAVVVTWALWSARRALRRHRGAGVLLVGGWVTYGVMAVVGELLHLRSTVYRPLGQVVADGLFEGRLAPAADLAPPLGGPYETLLVDTMGEESLELVAVTLLLAGAAALVRARRDLPA